MRFDAIDADGSGTLEKREIVRALSTDPRVKADLLAVSHGALAPLCWLKLLVFARASERVGPFVGLLARVASAASWASSAS